MGGKYILCVYKYFLFTYCIQFCLALEISVSQWFDFKMMMIIIGVHVSLAWRLMTTAISHELRIALLALFSSVFQRVHARA